MGWEAPAPLWCGHNSLVTSAWGGWVQSITLSPPRGVAGCIKDNRQRRRPRAGAGGCHGQAQQSSRSSDGPTCFLNVVIIISGDSGHLVDSVTVREETTLGVCLIHCDQRSMFVLSSLRIFQTFPKSIFPNFSKLPSSQLEQRLHLQVALCL